MTNTAASSNPFFGASTTSESSSQGSNNPFFAKAQPQKASSEPSSYVSAATASVNRMFALLASDISSESLTSEVSGLRQRTLQQVPSRHRVRLLEHVERSASVPGSEEVQAASDAEFANGLLGRCFNLSMNLKILAGNGASASIDSTLATRILSDLRTIEASLERRSQAKSGELGALMADLAIEKTTGRRPRLGVL